MKIILDAHAIIWALYAEERLTQTAKAQLKYPNNLLLVSDATLWDLLAKVGRGKLLIAGDSVSAVVEDIHGLGVAMLPLRKIPSLPLPCCRIITAILSTACWSRKRDLRERHHRLSRPRSG